MATYFSQFDKSYQSTELSSMKPKQDKHKTTSRQIIIKFFFLMCKKKILKVVKEKETLQRSKDKNVFRLFTRNNTTQKKME